MSEVWRNWLWAYKTGNIPETVEDRAKVTINGLCKVIHGLSTAAQMYDLLHSMFDLRRLPSLELLGKIIFLRPVGLWTLQLD